MVKFYSRGTKTDVKQSLTSMKGGSTVTISQDFSSKNDSTALTLFFFPRKNLS